MTPQQWARRGVFVRFLVIVTWALFVAMVGLLFYRWLITNEPSSVAVVNAGTELAGAVVIVDGVGLAAPYQSKIDALTGAARFFLGPGRYTVRVLSKDQQQTLYEAEFTMPPNRAVQFDLVKWLSPATQPSK